MHGTKVTTLSLESIDQFRSWSLGRGQSQNTIKAYTSDLKEFLKAVGDEEIQMEEFEELARSWLNLKRTSVKPKTTGRRLTSLRNFAKWTGEQNPIADYIVPTPGKPIPHPIPEGLEGVQRMADLAKNHEQAAIIGLCGFAGLRISEALSTTIPRFDIRNMLVEVRGKGDKTRVVPVSERAWSAISSAYVMAGCRDQKELISYKDRFARKIITNLGEKAGISVPVSSHDLRATFATHVYNKTQNLRLVQELLGHANSSQTEVYTGVLIKSMQEAVEL